MPRRSHLFFRSVIAQYLVVLIMGIISYGFMGELLDYGYCNPWLEAAVWLSIFGQDVQVSSCLLLGGGGIDGYHFGNSCYMDYTQ